MKIKTPNIRKLTLVLMIILLTTSLTSLTVLLLISKNKSSNPLTVYKTSLWAGMQLQIQNFRFLDYLRNLKEKPSSSIDAYINYEILLSRVDLLKIGPISNQIHYMSDGRSIQLLNIIQGEYELLETDIIEIEHNNFEKLDQVIAKIQHLDERITQLVNLINQGTQTFFEDIREQIVADFSILQKAMIIFLVNVLVLFFVFFRNIKITHKSLQLVETSHQKVSQLLLRKKHFLDNIGHEVRTPLSRSLSMINLLKKTNLDKEQSQIISTTENACKSLLNLVNDFLDLSKIESGNLDIKYFPVSLLQEIDDILTTSIDNINSNQKSVQLLSYIDLNLPEEVIIDRQRLRQILFNLIDNAFKFTSEGHISVVVRLSQSKSNKWRPIGYENTFASMIQIIIKDTGIGVPEKVIEVLKAPINDESMKVPETRNGLGLTLCRFLIHLMKGKIFCHNQISGGSEFILELPLFHQHALSINNNQNIKHLLDFVRNKTMIIIDKDPAIAHILATQANALGIQTPIYKCSLQELPEQKIDFIYLANDESLDEVSYMNIQKLLNSGSIIMAHAGRSQPKSKDLAHHIYHGPFLHSNMINSLKQCI